MLMAWCKTVVFPVLQHKSYHNLVLSHWCMIYHLFLNQLQFYLSWNLCEISYNLFCIFCHLPTQFEGTIGLALSIHLFIDSFIHPSFGFHPFACKLALGSFNSVDVFLVRLTWTTYGQYSPFSALSLTHWGRDKMDAISQTTLSNAFLEWKCFNFDSNFTEICS